jgi:hypothetical protein
VSRRTLGIRLPYRTDAELEAIHRRDRHVRNRHYKQRQIAKQPCANACHYAPGLGLIPEAGCPIHDRAWVKAGEYHP